MRTLIVLALLGCVSCKRGPAAEGAETPSARDIPVAAVSASPVAVAPTPDGEPGPETREAPAIASRCEGVRLELKAETDRGQQRFVGTLVNTASRSFTLVEPGDGSEVGWRTPTITWKVTTLAGSPVPRVERGRCGNINSIRDKEIFDLAPRGRHVFDEWFGAPDVAPGKYVVRAVYENNPQANLDGVPLGSHSATALARVRKSTPCRVESNAITVDVASP
ncbi:MAG: hypothetical protein KF819_12165 [Labilithrix sp.]|nr:hypothetical protein [Labilithrix sp.]